MNLGNCFGTGQKQEHFFKDHLNNLPDYLLFCCSCFPEMPKHQTSFVVTNDRDLASLHIGVGQTFPYFSSPIIKSFFEVDMLSNSNTSYSISYITHGHIFRHGDHDTRQGCNFEKISPHHLHSSPASEFPICCLSKGLLQNCNSNSKQILRHCNSTLLHHI